MLQSTHHRHQALLSAKMAGDIGDRGAIMSSQKISRGSHRLGVFLAAIPLLIGTCVSIVNAVSEADYKLKQYQVLLCANRHVQKTDKELADNPIWTAMRASARLQLKVIGCSDWEGATVSFGEARNPPDFDWLSARVEQAAFGFAITLVATFSVYGLARAIGWVVGGLRGVLGRGMPLVARHQLRHTPLPPSHSIDLKVRLRCEHPRPA